METTRTVKDVAPHEFVKAYAAHLKRSGKFSPEKVVVVSGVSTTGGGDDDREAVARQSSADEKLKKRLGLLSRSGMPVERNIVPFGPYLSPGTKEVGAAEKFIEKILVRTFPVAIDVR
ncbi:hypothetical protein L1887_14254 [Cichorium endivia]|nr:hypothetical protein L1887_14250 [Cichorium endivia]KAI3515371.1 hypothetical protein L1887_14254 [Cichorium endivia]